MSSSLSEAIIIGALDRNDLAFWETLASHFREKLDMMTSSASTATPMRHAFESRVSEVKSPKSDINALILDYLTMEGYPMAAAKFSKEANLQPQQEGASIKARQQIREHIHRGGIKQAIEALNDLDPEILDQDPRLHFALLRLQLVELIRSCGDGDITPALMFATNQLGPRAPSHPDFMEQLEKTMSLLIFPHNDLKPELAALLNPNLRRVVADDVNKAILARQNQRREAAIRNLVKMRAWAEQTARDNKKDIPSRIDLGIHGTDNADGISHENGHEPMITS